MTKNEIVMNFVSNMELERNKRGLTQSEMAKKLEMSTSAYRKIINLETQNISIYTMYLMYKMTGKFLYELVNKEVEASEIIRSGRNLSERQKQFVKSIIEFEEQFALEYPEKSNDYVTLIIPTGDVKDGMLWDSVAFKKISIDAHNKALNGRVNCAIQITSNHLHPAYVMNDILLIEKKPIRDGDIGIFINKEDRRAYIRKFRQTEPCRLEPINEYGETFLVDSYDEEDMKKWIKFGRVICKVR